METAYFANASQKKTVPLDEIDFKVKSIKMLHDKLYNSSRCNYDLALLITQPKNSQNYKEKWTIPSAID